MLEMSEYEQHLCKHILSGKILASSTTKLLNAYFGKLSEDNRETQIGWCVLSPIKNRKRF